MKKTLLAILACTLVLSATAVTAKKGHKSHRKHSKSSASKPTYYYNSDGTLSDKPSATASDNKRPSAYKGDNVPENDGQKKNVQRNINYNSGQSLPASNGSK